jgi:hypothetical protein
MAGLWEIVRYDTEGERLSQHFLGAAAVLYAKGSFTRAQLRTALEGNLGRTFTSEEVTDLTAIADAIDAESGAVNKLIYTHVLEAVGVANENAAVTETVWRNLLGI